MDIFQLKEFTTLVRTLSFSETAFLLNISDSALSRHIQQLEKEFGGKLFDRTTRSITLTEYGKEFLPYAFKILKDYEDGMNALNKLKDLHSGSFRLGSYYSVDEYDISDFVSGFLESNDKYTPVISFGNLEDLERGYKKHLFNVYTSINNPVMRDFNFLKIGDASVKAVIAADSDYRKLEKLSINELSGVPLFLPGSDSPFTKSILLNFQNAAIDPKVMYYGRFEDSIKFIKKDNSVGLFYFRTDEIPEIEGLKIIDLEQEINYEYGICYRDDLNDGEQAFVDYMKRIAAEIEQRHKV